MIESPTSVLSATKGTPEYNELLDHLKKTVYAHQNDDEGKKMLRALLSAPSVTLSENIIIGKEAKSSLQTVDGQLVESNVEEEPVEKPKPFVS